ncbi:MAG TPA: polymer-forming cytoskeletal protein [Polyangiaceae bacterium]|jgi:cytoskeletal protein CcmA (bactofilin family)|nr:polymer-forming cytoskeletal protein [Polyangiaceae bacterium]
MGESSVIGASTVVSGHVRGEGSLEILGRIEGDVTVTGEVVVGASGRVRGTVSGTQLTISGQVQGDLRGSEVVLIERGGRVAGDIASPRIGIAPGAFVRGHVQTDGEAALPAASASATNAQRRPTIARVAPAPLPASLLKAPHKAEPRKLEPMRAANPAPAEAEAPRAAKPEPRRPPPPVIPVLGKGIKAKKKKGRE